MLSIAILLPTLVLFGLVYTSTSEQTDFADLEHQGIEYLSSLLPVEIALIDAQAAAVAGQQVPRENLNRAVETATTTNAKLGASLRTDERWAEVRAKIEALPDLRSTGAQDVYNAYTEVTDLLLALIEKVRTSSNLVRDPDADTFYLQDAAAQELPEAIAAAGQLADLAVIVAGKPAAEQQASTADLLSQRSALASNASDLADGVRLAVDATGSRTLGANLLSRLDRFRKVIDALIPSTSLLQGRTAAVDLQQIARTRAEAQTAAAELSQAMLREIDLLVDARVSDLNTRLLLAAGTAVLAVLLLGAGLGLDLLGRRRPRAGAGSPPVPPVEVTPVSAGLPQESVSGGRHAWPPPQSGAPPVPAGVAAGPPGSPDPSLAQLAQWEQFGASR
ncbi:hypothetical protein GCM10009557_50460 [Virgisporangium ochraceum]|uniref:Methyl-accepting chemotaxis protein n=1 Tax=Virgisporangium ochraceum TaxID=65505 RepID=A0A8J4A892_9ACTN|nr:hypothetical protein [Virgisporangium ochraceum]GIJ75170.1 hypothetical protein Voc01_100870 [Virgisporangium ochraceum]